MWGCGTLPYDSPACESRCTPQLCTHFPSHTSALLLRHRPKLTRAHAHMHMHTRIAAMLVVFHIDMEFSKAHLDSSLTVGWYVSGPAEQNNSMINQWEGPKQKGAILTAKSQAYPYRAVLLKVNQELLQIERLLTFTHTVEYSTEYRDAKPSFSFL